MEEEKRPLHSPEHFEKALDRIIEHKGEKDSLWWLQVSRLGGELKDSVEGGTVNMDKENRIKERMSDFMEKGGRKRKYEKSLGVKASFWWKIKD
jgi:hypothetical protein